MDQLRSLRIYVEVVAAGSFAGAARTLNIAPPIVTKAVSELETALGARLLNRTTRRLALTDIGERRAQRADALPSVCDTPRAARIARADDRTYSNTAGAARNRATGFIVQRCGCRARHYRPALLYGARRFGRRPLTACAARMARRCLASVRGHSYSAVFARQYPCVFGLPRGNLSRRARRPLAPLLILSA